MYPSSLVSLSLIEGNGQSIPYLIQEFTNSRLFISNLFFPDVRACKNILVTVKFEGYAYYCNGLYNSKSSDKIYLMSSVENKPWSVS